MSCFSHFLARGLPVAAGWRSWEQLKASGISPDGMVSLERSPYGPSSGRLWFQSAGRPPGQVPAPAGFPGIHPGIAIKREVHPGAVGDPSPVAAGPELSVPLVKGGAKVDHLGSINWSMINVQTNKATSPPKNTPKATSKKSFIPDICPCIPVTPPKLKFCDAPWVPGAVTPWMAMPPSTSRECSSDSLGSPARFPSPLN